MFVDSHGTPSDGLTVSEPMIGSSPAGSTQPPAGADGGAGSSPPHPATRAAASSATASGVLPLATMDARYSNALPQPVAPR